MFNFLCYLVDHENPWIGFMTVTFIGGVVGLFVGVSMLLLAFLLVSTNGLILVPLAAPVVYVLLKEYKKFKAEEFK